MLQRDGKEHGEAGSRVWVYGLGWDLSGLFSLLLQGKGLRTTAPHAAEWGLMALLAVLSVSHMFSCTANIITKLLGQMSSSWCLCSLWHKCRIVAVETVYNNQWIL